MRKFSRSKRQKLREITKIARTAFRKHDPLLVHIVPMRRCNLSCAYCNEYDDDSAPVPLAEMLARIDRLADLGTAVVTISGGEPMLHPDIMKIIRHIHDRGMVSTLITNGYFMVPDKIKALNEAKLDRLQISIDNVKPDEISKKSLRVLNRKLQHMAEHAKFDININSVLGAGVENPEDALTIAKRAIELGFTATMGVIHDEDGNLQPLSDAEEKVYNTFKSLDPYSITQFNQSFQKNLAAGKGNLWKCRAGARYLYICEEGLVHYCSQQRGYPGIPLLEYNKRDIAREFMTEKSCAHFCTIACVHQASTFDRFRGSQIKPPASSQTEKRLPLL